MMIRRKSKVLQKNNYSVAAFMQTFKNRKNITVYYYFRIYTQVVNTENKQGMSKTKFRIVDGRQAGIKYRKEKENKISKGQRS